MKKRKGNNSSLNDIGATVFSMRNSNTEDIQTRKRRRFARPRIEIKQEIWIIYGNKNGPLLKDDPASRIRRRKDISSRRSQILCASCPPHCMTSRTSLFFFPVRKSSWYSSSFRNNSLPSLSLSHSLFLPSFIPVLSTSRIRRWIILL